jgi:hypothetical protein
MAFPRFVGVSPFPSFGPSRLAPLLWPLLTSRSKGLAAIVALSGARRDLPYPSGVALGRAGDDLAAQAVRKAKAPRQRDQEQGDVRHGIEVPRLLVLDSRGTDGPAACGATGHQAHEGARARTDPAQRRTKSRADVQTARNVPRGLESLLPARRL